MKKLLTTLLITLISLSTYATHLMGGQIVATNLGGYDYEIKLTAYRDTIGVPMATAAMFEISMDSAGVNLPIYFLTVPADSMSGGLVMGVSAAYGVEVYTYTDTVTLPGDGYYTISWQDCCRNIAIINMANAGGESFALSTSFTVDSLSPNSSPSYLSLPVAYLPSDTLWQYNPLPFDPDGDSLVWSLTVPLGDNGIVNGYQFLDDTTFYSNSSHPFALDSITGELSWNAKTQGNFVAAFLIEEYRNGVKIGEMRRDMQYIVVSDTSNYLPIISNMMSFPSNSGGYPYVVISPSQNYSVSLLASDPNINDVVTLSAFGEPFNLQTSSPSFLTFSTGNGNEIEGVFSWTPNVLDVRTQPYLVVFRVSDGFFNFDYTVQIQVSSITSIQELEIKNINDNKIYDLLGRELSYIPTGAIYIKNGKKFIK
jgi:hypothetical protein|tara:strand:+ start:580 stop:1854 length:1275 start_codon:yes stop_codon:yes gene_type:complete